jgi:hypothetical protein
MSMQVFAAWLGETQAKQRARLLCSKQSARAQTALMRRTLQGWHACAADLALCRSAAEMSMHDAAMKQRRMSLATSIRVISSCGTLPLVVSLPLAWLEWNRPSCGGL